ncbi:unnamed protein product [Nesidiocoris tenuis]|uniref:Integrin alpha third immunoglobulin-like domain-containing protein n=1 Tax=Nesidiocoris tenuis TaxID=355587 RepID=A0A6H5G7J1_9HEMI|nr:unnamed protein product [Nesidiocoris tenuis]
MRIKVNLKNSHGLKLNKYLFLTEKVAAEASNMPRSDGLGSHASECVFYNVFYNSATSVEKYVLGSGKRLEIEVEVQNEGEDAFESSFELQIDRKGKSFFDSELGETGALSSSSSHESSSSSGGSGSTYTSKSTSSSSWSSSSNSKSGGSRVELTREERLKFEEDERRREEEAIAHETGDGSHRHIERARARAKGGVIQRTHERNSTRTSTSRGSGASGLGYADSFERDGASRNSGSAVTSTTHDRRTNWRAEGEGMTRSKDGTIVPDEATLDFESRGSSAAGGSSSRRGQGSSGSRSSSEERRSEWNTTWTSGEEEERRSSGRGGSHHGHGEGTIRGEDALHGSRGGLSGATLVETSRTITTQGGSERRRGHHFSTADEGDDDSRTVEERRRLAEAERRRTHHESGVAGEASAEESEDRRSHHVRTESSHSQAEGSARGHHRGSIARTESEQERRIRLHESSDTAGSEESVRREEESHRSRGSSFAEAETERRQYGHGESHLHGSDRRTSYSSGSSNAASAVGHSSGAASSFDWGAVARGPGDGKARTYVSDLGILSGGNHIIMIPIKNLENSSPFYNELFSVHQQVLKDQDRPLGQYRVRLWDRLLKHLRATVVTLVRTTAQAQAQERLTIINDLFSLGGSGTRDGSSDEHSGRAAEFSGGSRSRTNSGGSETRYSSSRTHSSAERNFEGDPDLDPDYERHYRRERRYADEYDNYGYDEYEEEDAKRCPGPVRCTRIICDIGALKKDQEVHVAVRSRLWVATIKKVVIPHTADRWLVLTDRFPHPSTRYTLKLKVRRVIRSDRINFCCQSSVGDVVFAARKPFSRSITCGLPATSRGLERRFLSLESNRLFHCSLFVVRAIDGRSAEPIKRLERRGPKLRPGKTSAAPLGQSTLTSPWRRDRTLGMTKLQVIHTFRIPGGRARRNFGNSASPVAPSSSFRLGGDPVRTLEPPGDLSYKRYTYVQQYPRIVVASRRTLEKSQRLHEP